MGTCGSRSDIKDFKATLHIQNEAIQTLNARVTRLEDEIKRESELPTEETSITQISIANIKMEQTMHALSDQIETLNEKYNALNDIRTEVKTEVQRSQNSSWPQPFDPRRASESPRHHNEEKADILEDAIPSSGSHEVDGVPNPYVDAKLIDAASRVFSPEVNQKFEDSHAVTKEMKHRLSKSFNQEIINSSSAARKSAKPIRNYMRQTAAGRHKHIGMTIEEDPVTKWKTVHQELTQRVVESRSSELEYMTSDAEKNQTTLQISASSNSNQDKSATSQSSTVDSANVTLSLD